MQQGQKPSAAPRREEPLQWHRLGIDRLGAALQARPWGLMGVEMNLVSKGGHSLDHLFSIVFPMGTV